MSCTPTLLPALIQAISETITENAEHVTQLDQAIGDGDHVINLQRGLAALTAQTEALAQLDWAAALQKIGMTLMSTVGGASGSLYGTLFLAMSKACQQQPLTISNVGAVFYQGVEAMKQRGKSDIGEKTMLDVLIPVAVQLQHAAQQPMALNFLLDSLDKTAIAGMESTQAMLATKGRASFLAERSRGWIDAGAKTAQLMICAITAVLRRQTAQ